MLLLVSCAGDRDVPDSAGEPGESGGPVPLIFAAASLADVLGEAAGMYESNTGKQVDFSFGGSMTLANQIASFGAPADGIFFVGEGPVDVIAKAGLVSRSNNTVPFSNSLVVIGSGDEGPLDSLAELASKNARTAIGDPLLAPAGVYARQALESAGVWDEVSSLAILTLDVRAAMAAVESGNARFGIVYKTDAETSDTLSVVLEIKDGYSPITYTALPIEGARNARSAGKFLDFVSSKPEARSLFQSAGFTIGGVPGRPDSNH